MGVLLGSGGRWLCRVERALPLCPPPPFPPSSALSSLGGVGGALVSLHHLPSHHRASEGDTGVQGQQPRAGGKQSRMFSPFS